MKTMKLFITGLLFIAAISSQAQVSVNVNIGTPNVKVNVGSPPEWGPVGYNAEQYYYLPDIEVYYDIRSSQYIYFGNGNWIRATQLPSRWRNYNLYDGYKVVLTDYHGNAPYTYFKSHKVKYYKGYKGKPQKNRGEYHGNSNKHEDNGNHGNHGNHDKHEGKGNGKGKH